MVWALDSPGLQLRRSHASLDGIPSKILWSCHLSRHFFADGTVLKTAHDDFDKSVI